MDFFPKEAACLLNLNRSFVNNGKVDIFETYIILQNPKNYYQLYLRHLSIIFNNYYICFTDECEIICFHTSHRATIS